MRKKFLKLIAHWTVTHTWWMTVAILVLTTFFAYRASTLQMRTGFDSLLPGDNPRTAEFNRILEEFQNESNIMLLAKGNEDSLKAYAQSVKPLLEDFDEWVASVHIQIPEDFYRRNALKLLPPDQLDNFGSMFYDPNLVPFLHNLNNSFEGEYQRNDEALQSRRDELDAVRFLDGLEMFVDIQSELMNGESGESVGQKAVDAITFGETYMLSPNKDMILILIEPTFNMMIEPAELQKSVNGIEKIIKEASAHYGVTAGLTGSIVLGRDEYEAFTSDSWTVSILALIGIFILFVISFRMWVSPLLAILTVIMGVTWAMGFSSFLVEYLSMMTAMMSVILIGLGIDFSVHIISGYTEKRNQGLDVRISMEETLLRFGPGIITGGITTGLAFLTLMVSETVGMQEMGLMAGVGIIFTMLATIIILPTLLVIRERLIKNFNKSLPPKDVSYPSLGRIAVFTAKYRWIMGIFFLLITGFLYNRAVKMSVDYNYLNMEPVGLESIKLQEELIEAFDLSSDFVMFTTDNLDDARELTRRAREMETAGWVESISDYLPDSDGLEEQYRFLKNLRRNLENREIRKQMSSYDVKMYRKELERLEANIIELQDLAFLGGQDKVYDKAIKLVGEAGDSLGRGNITQFINALDTGLTKIELTYFQQQFSTAFKSTIIGMANTEPLTLDNLPSEIKNRFTGKSGNIFIINVYPEKNIWEDARFLYRFTHEATGVSKKATGLPPIFVELMDIMSKDGKKATYLAIIAVFLVLLIDFRSLKYALVGMVPLIFGAIWMTGFMEISGLKFTMMNILAVPLIIGIGIDDGVHILHRWKMEKNLDIVYRSTGKAILLTSLTTMLGFGSLWFATYRGLGSMGIALFIGVGTCFLASLFIMPAILGLKNNQ
ncbi:MAG: MMPL family transporter [Candidatus Marinimicrobia bacterium]|nr:MMPL family transporter [Candidatus Neomarinimicrobiota bacterium]